MYSGLDWSGSPGKAHGRFLVFAIAHLDENDMQLLDSTLATVRRQLRITDGFPFRHSDVAARTKAEFFAAVQGLPVTAHVHMLDKTMWTAQYVSGSDGPDCICDGIISLLMGCPSSLIDSQMLYIDLPRRETKLVQRYRTTIRKALRRAKKPAFRDMKPRPDDRTDGAIIQLADMVAGEVRQHRGIAGPYLPAFQSRIRIV